MRKPVSAVAGSGLGAGALLFVHGLFPNTHAYPFLWPFVGGVLGVWFAARSSATPPTLWRDTAIGVRVGAIAAVVAAVGFVAGYYVLSLPASEWAARRLGAAGPVPWSLTAAGLVALVAFLAVPAALAGSLLAHPFVRRGHT